MLSEEEKEGYVKCNDVGFDNLGWNKDEWTKPTEIAEFTTEILYWCPTVGWQGTMAVNK